MKKILYILLVVMMIILSACGKKTTSTKTANTSSKTVSQVLEEKTNATNNTNDKNHGGNVTNPNDNSNKPSSSFNKIGEVGASSNLKKSKSTKNMQASDIDIDLTTLSSTMVYSEVYNMMNSPEKYVGKMVRMNGKFAVYKYPERNYYTCIIADATACCQQGMEFMWKGEHKYPDDYPNEGDGIIVTGEFDIYYEGDNKYCQLKNASLVKSRA